jgi:exopolyphosphatase/guanosine-5'-triphosphate,3'-diphosphate pyrophosphatase
MKTQKIAAIDIGSNSIKLVVAEAAAADSFVIIYADKESVRLGHDTLRNKYLSDAAIKRAAASISRFCQIADSRGANRIIAVATASVREAENAAEFLQIIENQTGVQIEILSPIEEARLIGIAVANFCGKNAIENLLNIDIGGGSTELSLIKSGEPEQLFSMKIGAVGLTERFLQNDPPTDKQFFLLKQHISAALERPVRELAGEHWSLATGTSGTILALSRYASDGGGGGGEISLSKLTEFNARLARMNLAERLQIPNISRQRAEIFVAGGQILEGAMRALKIKTLRPCEYALREGVIIDYLREAEAESLPPVPDVADRRLKGVFAVGRRFGYEENHSLQVAAVAEKIFDRLAKIYNLARHERTLLSAAALLHDIGYHISHSDHHKHSLYLIKHSELTGFSEQERNVIANVARYHRGSLPKEKHLDFMSLSEAEKQVVWRLGAILRLADALDRSYASQVSDIKISKHGRDLLLEVESRAECENELETARQKAEMFEIAFGCRLFLMRTPLGAKAKK